MFLFSFVTIRKWSFYLAMCIAAFAGAAEGKQSENFVVGTTSGYAPYVSLNPKGEYEGFDVDFAHLVAERLGRKLVIEDLGSMPSLLVALQKKKIDAIIWAMSITEDRKKEMEMIYYQGEKVKEMPFVFWNEMPKELKTIEDLSKLPNCTVCVEAGSYQDSVLQNYPKLQVKYLDKIADAIMEVKCRKALTATIDNSLLRRVGEQYPEIKVAMLPLPPNQQALGNGVCINKSEQELAKKVSQIIADLTAEGKIAELEKKWNIVQQD